MKNIDFLKLSIYSSILAFDLIFWIGIIYLFLNLK
jgi:hypothetical protein